MFAGKRVSARDHNGLIDALKAEGAIRLNEVEAVMRSVDRSHYVLTGTAPYEDRPQSIGFNATISAPHMHAMMLEMLLPALKNGRFKRALDVGAGSGYLTTCMALLQGERGGLVIGIEHIPELAQFAEENIRRDQPALVEAGRVRIVVGDGRRGHRPEAPYDAIHVGAAAPKEPEELKAQLAPGGRMVVPVGARPGFQELQLIERSADGQLHTAARDLVAFVPLTDRASQLPPPPPSLATRAQLTISRSSVEAAALAQSLAPIADASATSDPEDQTATGSEARRPSLPFSRARRSSRKR